MARTPPDEETAPHGAPITRVPFVDPAPDWDRYAVIELVGEGGMGVVYRAVDRQLRRTVALKFLRSSDPDEIARFQREAKAQAGLDHENVCRVFEVGEVDGRGFIAMQFINGDTLRTLGSELDLVEKLELLEQVARAVQAAHTAGVVHRDLKPGNVMVERRPDGRLHAYVLDFGIAHESTVPDELAPAVPMGTPAFMAPEQILNDNRVLDHRVDVWGLGATLYAVLAEQAPFFGATRAETKEKVLEEEPIRLGLVVPGTSEDLETIVTVAMAKDPARRYPSARAFADDLRRWLEGEPIRTRRADPYYRLSTWIRTRRLAAAVVALVVVTSAAAASSALWLRYRENQRQVLVDRHQNEVEQIDRLLRRARMMPLHDTGGAESEVRRRLADVEASLLATGPLARGPAYYALGFGHLMLREFEFAEEWLQAAMDSGFDPPEVESALGIAQAMRILAVRGSASADTDWGGARIGDAVQHLERSGPTTIDRDDFHRAMGLFLLGRLDEALDRARASSDSVPWLYEALQLEGDILVARSARRSGEGDQEGAAADLRRAGDAYERALTVARSDAWLYEAEAARALRLVELGDSAPEFSLDLIDRAIGAAAAAGEARPHRGLPLALASRAHLLKAEILGENGETPESELVQAMRLANSAADLEPESREIAHLCASVEARLRESRGGDPRL